MIAGLVCYDLFGSQQQGVAPTDYQDGVAVILLGLRFVGLIPVCLFLFGFTFLRAYDQDRCREHTLSLLAIIFAVVLLAYEYYLLAFVKTLAYGIPIVFVGFLHVFYPIQVRIYQDSRFAQRFTCGA